MFQNEDKNIMLDWDDFNAIFCKGIFLSSVISTAKSLMKLDTSKESNLFKKFVAEHV
jgi:hypothetical protein